MSEEDGVQTDDLDISEPGGSDVQSGGSSPDDITEDVRERVDGDGEILATGDDDEAVLTLDGDEDG